MDARPGVPFQYLYHVLWRKLRGKCNSIEYCYLFERKCRKCELCLLDHYFNVSLGVSGHEMELTRTCCFEFDRKRQPDSKRLFLRTFCFYFMVAGFTYLSSLPEVDKNLALYQNFETPIPLIRSQQYVYKCSCRY